MYSLKLRKVTEEHKGMPWNWICAAGVYAILAIVVPVILILITDSNLIRFVLFVVMVYSGIKFYKNMRSPELLNSSWLELKYLIRVHRGEHIIPKHVVPLQFLKGIIPLETTHSNGLIEYTNNRFAIMYQLFVPGRTGDELDAFIALVTKNIIDRIHDGQVLKVFEMQRYTTDTSIKNQVATAMNDESKSPEQREHLNSIYQQLLAKKEIPTKRYIYATIILGRFDSVEDAIAERDNLVPSIEDGFRLGGIGYQMLITQDTIGLTFRRCIK